MFVIKQKNNWCCYSKHVLKNTENTCRNTSASEKISLGLDRDSWNQGIISSSATALGVIIYSLPPLRLPLHTGDWPLLESLSSFPTEKRSMKYWEIQNTNMNVASPYSIFPSLVCLPLPLCWTGLCYPYTSQIFPSFPCQPFFTALALTVIHLISP